MRRRPYKCRGMGCGEIVTSKDQKEKNDWKTRMLKAGLSEQGLDIPEDWDTISEAEKERRLNNTIEFLSKEKKA